nr:GDP-L-fucose synthase [Candidatus Omnitrophota bacterium]
METKSSIYVTGGNEFIGSAIVNILKRDGYDNIINPGIEPDLHDKVSVDKFFAKNKPEYVFLTAGKSAGIIGNTKMPASLMMDNLIIACNVIDSAYRHGVKKLFYLASSCCYPKHCSQPMKESDLLTGILEPTSEPYAVAKIAGLKLAQSYKKQYGADFICGISANIFGPRDDFSIEDSHVIGALIRKIHDAKSRGLKEVMIWGTGKPRREFIYVDDLAGACICVMRNYSDIEPINLGYGEDISIHELALLIKKVIGFKGKIILDSSKPDGMPVKLLDSHKLKEMGWKPAWLFEKALAETYKGFLEKEI